MPGSSAPACRSTPTRPAYDHEAFRPWRSGRAAFKALRQSLSRTIRCGATFAYEYERGRLAIDVINGGPLLREWVDDPAAVAGDLDALARRTSRPG